MLALYRSGRQSDALATYQQLRDHLDEELGLEPSPELRKLHQAILEHAPQLQTLTGV
jgi:DNA-binding SARP family transcriptional activator